MFNLRLSPEAPLSVRDLPIAGASDDDDDQGVSGPAEDDQGAMGPAEDDQGALGPAEGFSDGEDEPPSSSPKASVRKRLFPKRAVTWLRRRMGGDRGREKDEEPPGPEEVVESCEFSLTDYDMEAFGDLRSLTLTPSHDLT